MSVMSDMASLRSSSRPLTRPLMRFIMLLVSGGMSFHGAGYCTQEHIAGSALLLATQLLNPSIQIHPLGEPQLMPKGRWRSRMALQLFSYTCRPHMVLLTGIAHILQYNRQPDICTSHVIINVSVRDMLAATAILPPGHGWTDAQ